MDGVNDIIISNFEKQTFMLDRLKSQILTVEKFGPTVFLDADMLVVKKLDEIDDFLNKFKLILTKREVDFLLSDNLNGVSFAEFKNKYAKEVMPFNGAFLACSDAKVLKKDKKNL